MVRESTGAARVGKVPTAKRPDAVSPPLHGKEKAG